jgi:hypothetical protein
MSQQKYIGMGFHQATISAAVMNARGEMLMECVLETKRGVSVNEIGPVCCAPSHPLHVMPLR